MADPTLVYVKPAPGLKVRDPRDRRHVPADGAWLPDTTYLRRRLRSGDLAKATPPKPAKAPKATAGEES